MSATIVELREGVCSRCKSGATVRAVMGNRCLACGNFDQLPTTVPELIAARAGASAEETESDPTEEDHL